jgi:hypothetical protein
MHLICANLTVIAGGAFFVRKNSRNRVGVKIARRSGHFGTVISCGISCGRCVGVPDGPGGGGSWIVSRSQIIRKDTGFYGF